jgi:hypothetical protein
MSLSCRPQPDQFPEQRWESFLPRQDDGSTLLSAERACINLRRDRNRPCQSVALSAIAMSWAVVSGGPALIE